jgi:hypothetical protein
VPSPRSTSAWGSSAPTSRRVPRLLDDGEVDAVLLQLLGHHEADVAAADDGDASTCACAGRSDPGSHASLSVVPMNTTLSPACSSVAPVGMTNSSARMRPTTSTPVGQLRGAERLIQEGIVLLEAVLQHGDAAAGEARAVHRARHAHDVGDLVRQDALRPQHPVHQQADRLEGALLLEGVDVALARHERHRLLRPQALGRQARQHVHVVVGGARHEGVRPSRRRRRAGRPGRCRCRGRTGRPWW